jgi:Reverse transcriptase (RNA-dependent DNA polymerase)
LTIAAPNRPALALFIDFSTAFDRLWWPALFHTLENLEMPIELRKWIFNWLQNRWMRVSHGEAKSRLFPILIGAPQGSVLAAVLFRLHLHFLPLYFPQIVNHLFADDLTLIIKGALEKRLSDNIIYIQNQSKVILNAFETFSDNYLLPVNVGKTKAMLVHNAVSVSKPMIEYKGVLIEYVSNFKCLGVHIGSKLGWGKFIDDRLHKVKQSYSGLKKILISIPKNEIKLRRKLFLAFSLPQFIWLFFASSILLTNKKKR